VWDTLKGERQLLRCECGWNGPLHRKLGQYSQGDKTLPIEALWVAYLFSGLGLNQMRWVKLVVVQPLSYPQDHALRSCSVLFARYFVIVISCVVYFISSLAPDRASLAERRLCVCHYLVAVSMSIACRHSCG
jgi:hypothetical protein